MESRQITRRFVVTALGGGVALAPVIAKAALSNAMSSHDSNEGGPLPDSASSQTAASAGSELLAPLMVGSTVAGCTLSAIGDVSQGALGLLLTDRSGGRFGIEICARDENSPRSPAETANFQLYVVNEGDGALPTTEEHGLAAMAIAAFIRKNEASVDGAGFLTLEQRLSRHGGEIIRPD